MQAAAMVHSWQDASVRLLSTVNPQLFMPSPVASSGEIILNCYLLSSYMCKNVAPLPTNEKKVTVYMNFNSGN